RLRPVARSALRLHRPLHGGDQTGRTAKDVNAERGDGRRRHGRLRPPEHGGRRRTGAEAPGEVSGVAAERIRNLWVEILTSAAPAGLSILAPHHSRQPKRRATLERPRGTRGAGNTPRRGLGSSNVAAPRQARLALRPEVIIAQAGGLPECPPLP